MIVIWCNKLQIFDFFTYENWTLILTNPIGGVPKGTPRKPARPGRSHTPLTGPHVVFTTGGSRATSWCASARHTTATTCTTAIFSLTPVPIPTCKHPKPDCKPDCPSQQTVLNTVPVLAHSFIRQAMKRCVQVSHEGFHRHDTQHATL